MNTFKKSGLAAVIFAFCFAAFASIQAQTPVAAPPKIKAITFTCDRADQLYRVGENAAVTITVMADNGKAADAGTLKVAFTNDGRAVLRTESFDLSAANPITVNGTFAKPGYLQIQASASAADDAKPVNALLGLGFDLEKIEPALPKPDDFDDFWAKGKAEVRALPLDVQQEKIDSLCNDKHDVYSLSFATVNDRRVHGFLSIPKGDGPFPALVMVPGAGRGTGPDTSLVDQGFAVLVMNVFPYPVPLDDKERRKVYDDYLATRENLYYWLWDAADRDRYFFRPVYLGIDRAIDWFAEQPFVDKTRIGCFGTSQGGGSALILTGMNKNIIAAVAAVPALCDHGGFITGRSPGWPRLVDSYKDNKEAVLQASRYLDAVNFARSIDVPIRVTVGFIDVTCSPSSVWSAYNVIPSSDKKMVLEQKLGHSTGKGFQEAFEWLKNFVKKGGNP